MHNYSATESSKCRSGTILQNSLVSTVRLCMQLLLRSVCGPHPVSWRLYEQRPAFPEVETISSQTMAGKESPSEFQPTVLWNLDVGLLFQPVSASCMLAPHSSHWPHSSPFGFLSVFVSVSVPVPPQVTLCSRDPRIARESYYFLFKRGIK